jgi:hypothetical protein
MIPLQSQTGFRLRETLAMLVLLFSAISPAAKLWLPAPVTCGMDCCEASGVCYCRHHHTGQSEADLIHFGGEAPRAIAAKVNEVSLGRSCPAQCAQLPAGFQRHSIARAHPPRFASVTGAIRRSFIHTPYLARDTLTAEAHAPRAPPTILL